jgi:hypothetical protein
MGQVVLVSAVTEGTEPTRPGRDRVVTWLPAIQITATSALAFSLLSA